MLSFILILPVPTLKAQPVLPGNPPFFQNQNSKKLIVFIHGLTGDPVKTWSSDDDSPFFWPQQLANDPAFKNTDVLSFGYTSDIGAPLNIPQLAQHLETALAELNRFNQYESISFVAHSLGGLVTRQFILDHFQEIKIGTVVLLSTPNFGHHMSRMAKFISANAHLEQLDPAQGKYIDGLNDRWQKEFREKRGQEPFRMAAGYELNPLYRMFVKVGIIVEKYAAVNFSSHTQAFENDHIQIAKPRKESDPQYIWVRQQLLELPRDPRNREYSEAEEKRFEEIIDELQKELAGTDLEEALNLISQGKLDEALTLLSKNEAKEDEQVLKTAKIRFAKGQVYELKLDYKNALQYFEKAVQLAPENSIYPNYAGFIANILGQHNMAIGYYQKALESGLKSLGSDHPKVAIYRNNIGEAWRAKGKYKKAIGYYKKALESDLKTFGLDHPQVAIRWNNLGLAWQATGDYKKAIKYNKKALASGLKSFGPDHPQVALYRNNLGSAWQAKGDYNEAIKYYKKALESGLKSFGPDHPQVAAFRNSMGSAWLAKGDNDKAIGFFEQAKKIILKTFSPDHPHVATTWNNLGSAWKAKGDYDKAKGDYGKAIEYYDKAIEYDDKALASDLKTFGPDHPNVAIRWNNLGTVLYSKGEYDKAIGYFEKALVVLRKFGLDHYVVITEKSLADALKKKDGR